MNNTSNLRFFIAVVISLFCGLFIYVFLWYFFTEIPAFRGGDRGWFPTLNTLGSIIKAAISLSVVMLVYKSIVSLKRNS